MTTTATATVTLDVKQATSGRHTKSTLARIIHSEWIKFRTLRANWTMLGATMVLFIAFGAIAAAVSTGSVDAPNGGPLAVGGDALQTVLTGSRFALLLLGVLGALSGAREYASRMIVATVGAVPKRWHVVIAKAIVLTAVVLPTALIGAFGAFFAGNAVFASQDATTVALSDDGVVRALGGMAAFLVAIALLGLALGFLMRSVAGSIGTLIAGALIVPGIAGALLPDSWDELLKYLPTQAAASFTPVGTTGDTLSAGAGAIVLAVWVVALVAAATASITRRDV
ncbi:ABC transporter permease [Demequina gelatinilytica]|uniref:ABC transporter permease n=1 Tax=Demequina gelatinilytica TaxID=1638980 RepID=UPI0007866849|nr:ABC transporter permease [Demequina gelatinilytica]